MRLGAVVVVIGLLAGCGRGDDETPVPMTSPVGTTVPAATTPTGATAPGADAAGACWTDDQVTGRSADGRPNQWAAAPAIMIDPAGTYSATMETSAGAMTIELLPAIAPITVNNFVCLARAGYYDGTPIHRIVAEFVVQGGDPTGTGAGGPGYRFPDEAVQGDYVPGAMAMANAGADTNGSQFFLILSDLTGRLEKDYNLFGRVVAGQDVLETLGQTPVGPSARGELSVPISPVTLTSVTITEGTARAGTPAA